MCANVPRPSQRFRHSPLNKQAKEIRLVQLQPSPDAKSPVRLLMKHAVLGGDQEGDRTRESAPADDQISTEGFTALSYTWGPETPLYDVHIENPGHSGWLHVRQILYDFLVTRRDSPFEVERLWFWIDQLCINQADDEEKGHQVNQMSEIYKTATSVEVWLGPSFKGSDDAMDLIHQVWTAKRIMTKQEHTKNLPDLTQILWLPYWKRSWIVQEILLGSNIQVRLGKRTVAWPDSFLHVLKYMSWDTPESGTLFLWTRRTQLLEHVEYGKCKNYHWGEVSALAHGRDSTDARDRAFAMLGLIFGSLRFFPDYAMDAQTLVLTILRKQLSYALQPANNFTKNQHLSPWRNLESLALDWMYALDRENDKIDAKVVRRFLLVEAHNAIRASPYPGLHEFPRYSRPWLIIGVGPTPLIHLHLWWLFPSRNSMRWGSRRVRGPLY